MADLDIEDIKKKKINISVENLVLLGAGLVSLIGMWFALQAVVQQLQQTEVIQYYSIQAVVLIQLNYNT